MNFLISASSLNIVVKFINDFLSVLALQFQELNFCGPHHSFSSPRQKDLFEGRSSWSFHSCLLSLGRTHSQQAYFWSNWECSCSVATLFLSLQSNLSNKKRHEGLLRNKKRPFLSQVSVKLFRITHFSWFPVRIGLIPVAVKLEWSDWDFWLRHILVWIIV